MPSREIFWNISGSYVIYILAAISLSIFIYSIYRRYQLWRLGKKDDRFENIGKRMAVFLRTMLADALGHRRFLRDAFPGIMHFFIFWGFLLLLLAAVVDFVTHLTGQNIIDSAYLWLSLISDIGGILVLIGIAMAAYRRYILKPKRLNTVLDDGIVISLVAIITVTGFMIEGLRQADTEIVAHPGWAIWSPGGFVFAKAFSVMSPDLLLFWHRLLWWFHAGLVIGAITYCAVAFSKLQHIVMSPLNLFFRSLGPVGVPAPIDIEHAEILGVGDSKEFTWKQLLDVDACTNCGRCQDNCPAYLSGKPLSPRKLTQDIKGHWLARVHHPKGNPGNNTPALIGNAISEDEIWACTTCAACQEVCPVYEEHIVKVIDLRRNLVLNQSKMPETAQLMLRNLQTRGHPWAGVQSLRLRGDWTNGLNLKAMGEGDRVDTLLWVGCTGALVERNIAVTLSLVKVLKAAGVSFGVMGDAEACCGDPARRVGYEFLFQTLAEQNIENFKSHNIKEIITLCPHCYNTFKNEYSGYGADFKVVHHTQFVADLLREGRLKLTHALDSVITYHDPCYLGRYNKIYSDPREIIRHLPKARFKEMERSRHLSFCCGAGGGHTWIEEKVGRKINEIRIEDVLKTGAGTVLGACPYCLQMLEDGIERKGVKASLKAKDLIELVAEAMEPSK